MDLLLWVKFDEILQNYKDLQDILTFIKKEYLSKVNGKYINTYYFTLSFLSPIKDYLFKLVQDRDDENN